MSSRKDAGMYAQQQPQRHEISFHLPPLSYLKINEAFETNFIIMSACKYVCIYLVVSSLQSCKTYQALVLANWHI